MLGVRSHWLLWQNAIWYAPYLVSDQVNSWAVKTECIKHWNYDIMSPFFCALPQLAPLAGYCNADNAAGMQQADFVQINLKVRTRESSWELSIGYVFTLPLSIVYNRYWGSSYSELGHKNWDYLPAPNFGQCAPLKYSLWYVQVK